MITHKVTQTKKEIHVEEGSILVAQPFWPDETFKRSVILILEHNEQRTTGLILNKQSAFCMMDVHPELGVGLPLYFGGPHYSNQIYYVHQERHFPDAIDLGNELFLNGNFNNLVEIIRNRKIKFSKIRFFAGLVQWGPGDLENELAHNKWWTSWITAQEFFTTVSEDLWSYELISNGHVYGLMSEFPDPRMS